MPLPSISDAIAARSLDDLKASFGLVPFMIDNLVVDVMTSLDTDLSFDVTDKPIQKDFTTFARTPQPYSISINGVFTNDLENVTAAGLAKSLLSGSFGIKSWKQKKKALEELARKNRIIKVITPNQKYENLMITNLNFYQGTTMDACFFSMSLKEVRVRVEKWEEVDPGDIPADLQEERDEETETKTKGKKRGGTKPPVAVEGTTELMDDWEFDLGVTESAP